MCNVLYNVLCPPLEQALDDPPLRRLDLQSLGLLFSDRLGVAAYEAQAVQVGTHHLTIDPQSALSTLTLCASRQTGLA